MKSPSWYWTGYFAELLNDHTGAGLGMTVAGLGITLAGLGINSGAPIAAACVRPLLPLLIAFITPTLVKHGRQSSGGI
jgi:hypothetical protein